MYFILNTCNLRVFSRKFKLVFVYIESAYTNFLFRIDFRNRFFLDFFKQFAIDVFPIKIIEIPVNSARNFKRG